MRLEDLDLPIPEELIAQTPAEPRDACRLMVLERATGRIEHRVFRELPALLRPGDVLVINTSRVLPARVFAWKASGGRVELLFLRPAEASTLPAGAAAGSGGSAGVPGGAAPLGGSAGATAGEPWEVLARPSRRLQEGLSLALPDGVPLRLVRRLGEGRWIVSAEGASVLDLLDRHGELPLPPYVTAPPADRELYQTVYAAEPGSAAAPTAGLHFTPSLLERLAEAGVDVVKVTLHVGLDTFRPITEREVERHPMHTEVYQVAPETAAKLDAARAEGRRVFAVGTTAVRVLETLYAGDPPPAPHTRPLEDSTRLFITPGYRFRAVDGLITNFHLSRTSLLALVMAFAGVDAVRRAYLEAVSLGYRFFSFGDAMLILDRLPATGTPAALTARGQEAASPLATASGPPPPACPNGREGDR